MFVGNRLASRTSLFFLAARYQGRASYIISCDALAVCSKDCRSGSLTLQRQVRQSSEENNATVNCQ